MDLANSPTPKVRINSIFPTRGPVTGDTRVIVRGGPFAIWEIQYPHPVCKFGTGNTVRASYVTCTEEQLSLQTRETLKQDRSRTCIQCDNDDPSTSEGAVKFQISLTGDFSDSINSVDFEYFAQIQVDSIFPRYGPKDGWDPAWINDDIHIKGKNFKSIKGKTLVSFGTLTVVANVINSTYITCKSPQSDVVAKPIPVSVSQNDGSQFATSHVTYWYYNWPQITQLNPERGTEAGGTLITLRGRNFDPFKEVRDQVDNSPDVFCTFRPQNFRMPAKIISATTATCITPPSYYYHQTIVELTLNNYADTTDENVFYYYKPPTVYDLDPREGPLRGGNVIKVVGAGFSDTDVIQARIGGKIVNGTYINNQEIHFLIPPGDNSGYTDIEVSNKPNLWSTPIKYLYYEQPTVASIGPLCGPDTGFTQLAVTGKNFMDLGSNKAMCVFNGTVFMNATIMDDGLLYCDSPPYLDQQGYSQMGTNGPTADFYNVQITLDGGKQFEGDGFVFNYYKQGKVTGVFPFGGPLIGNTQTSINVTGLKQKNICDLRVRFSTQEVSSTKLNEEQLQVFSPSTFYPGTVVVQVTFNGQQYSNERIIGEKDPLSSFEYYANPTVSHHSPSQGPSSGNTAVKILGNGFSDFVPQDNNGDSVPTNHLFARLVDTITKSPLSPASEISSADFNNNEAVYLTPPLPAGTNALLQISRNNMDWLDVKDPNPLVLQSFQYFDSPHITLISPPFGPVKNPENIQLTLTGKNFACPNSDCSKLFVKFFDKKQTQIVVPATLSASNTVVCNIPKFTKPDVLQVEVTFNGVDYTNDNQTYGYYDPYLVDVKPRLIAVNGTTKLTLIGLGFADSGQIKVSFNNVSSPLTCNGQTCAQSGTYVDPHTITTTTLPQSAINYLGQKNSVANDPFSVGVAIYNDQYNDNNILVHYYQDATYQIVSSNQNPANTENNLQVQISINPNDVENIKKHGHPKARFTTPNNFTSYAECQLIFSDTDPTNPMMNCKIPKWDLINGNNVKLDLSVNGFDFTGNFDYTFTENLVLNRIVPMAGPLSLSTTPLRLIGLGFKPTDPSLEIDYKWGPVLTSPLARPLIQTYQYNFADFLNLIPNNEDLKSYWYEADKIQRVDSQMTDGNSYEMYLGQSVQLNIQNQSGFGYPSRHGGPFYVDVGRNLQVQKSNGTSWIYYDYQPAAVEYFYYKQCTALKMYPNHGLTIGGTKVQVAGFDFKFQPEYGVVPHCRFGDQIVRATFDSSVRIVCDSPASTVVGVQIPFEVSLNGVDWTNAGFTFSYFFEAEMYSYFPDSGSASGGTQIYIMGKNFPRLTNPQEFNARFSPQYAHMAPKIMAVDWLNSTCVRVTSPGGWSEGDKMALQLTFNGVDYDQHNFTYTMYNIKQMVPRSGPSNGLGGDILIKGEGFRSDLQYSCRLNGTVYDAVSFNWTEIRCPMIKAQDGDDFFGNVDFAVSANGGADWHEFTGGFQYYQQPSVVDVFPKTGPAHGLGIVNFYGSMFRTDYSFSQLSCKIGQTLGTAVFVSSQQIRCVVEDMESVPEGQRLSAQVALNGYSWTQTVDDSVGSTFFVPYSVNAIFPTSGPSAGGSEVIVIGSGFVSDSQNSPRCRFGTPSNYAIVQADILSYNKLSCTAPPSFQTKTLESSPYETPFSVALTQDNFDPWTQTYHRFRYYRQPVVQVIYPSEVEVGLITEVLAVIDPSSGADNIFFPPMPSDVGKFDPTGQQTDDVAATLLSNTQIKCRFGRFGETLAVIVNSTALKCVTPSVTDDPEDIYREKVKFTIAMNGYDFDEDTTTQDFTFVGTGYSLGLLPQILGILLMGVLIIAGIVFIQNYYLYLSRAFDARPARPYVADFGNDTIQQRALRVVHGSRSGQSVSRGAESMGRFQEPDSRPQSRVPPPYSPF